MNTLFDYMPNKTASSLLDGIAGYEDGGFVGLEHGGIYHDDEDQGSDSGVDYSGEPDFGGQDRGPTGTSGSNITPANLGVGGMSQGMLQNIMLAGGGDALAGGLNNMNFTTATPDATAVNNAFTDPDMARQFLAGRGIQLTDEQRALIADFDPSGIQSSADRLRGSLLGMSQQNLASQAGTGFAGPTGASQYRAGQVSGQAQQALADTTTQAIQDYQSQVLGGVADLVAGGADIAQGPAPVTNPNWNPPQDAKSYNFEGSDYYNAQGTWRTKDEIMDMIKEQVPNWEMLGGQNFLDSQFNLMYG